MKNNYLILSRDFIERNDIEYTPERELQIYLRCYSENHYEDCGEYQTPDDIVILQTIEYINGISVKEYIQKQIDEVRAKNFKKGEQVTLQLSKEELDLLEYRSEDFKLSYPDLYNKIHKLYWDLKND